MQTSVFVRQVSVMCFFNLIVHMLLLPRKHRPLRIPQKRSGYNRACFLIIRACKSFTQNININVHACVFLQSILSHFVSIFQIWGSGRSTTSVISDQFKSSRKISTVPFTFCFTRDCYSTESQILDADTDKEWQPAKVTQNCFIHIFTCLKHRA